MARRGTRLTAFGRLALSLRKPLYVFVALCLLFGGCNVLGDTAARRWTAQQPRAASSAYLQGGAPFVLGPDDATTAVLLVHGFVGGPNNFGELPERLAAEGYRVRAMSLPGHGTSPQDMALTPEGEYLLAVLREIRALRETHARVFVVGHSMGGALSALAAAIDDLDGLVLAAPYFGVTHKWYYGLTPEVWSAISRRAIKWTYKSDRFLQVKRREAVPHIFSYRWIPSEGSAALQNIGERASDPEIIEMVSSPVLWLHGPADDAADYHDAQRAFEAIGSADKSHVSLPESDHHVFWDYDREMAIEAVLAFVDKRSGV
jgi:carboxylesterase